MNQVKIFVLRKILLYSGLKIQGKNINRQTELILEKIWWLSDGEEKIKGGLMRAAGTRLDILIHK